MKTLMLLGGSRFALPVIEAAHALDCRVITCSYLPDDPAHRFSDGSLNVSVVDEDAVLEAARREKVDGILSFACDPGVVAAARVAEKLGLPSCGPAASAAILQHKGAFRRFLAENGFNTPFARCYASMDDALAEAERFRFPVMVKPADSAGSKGVGRADSPDELPERIRAAQARARCGEFLLEEAVVPRGHPTDCDAFYADGSLRFFACDSQLFDPGAANPYTPAGYRWPAALPEAKQAQLKGEVERLLRLLGMGASLYNIEAREGVDGKLYIMECAPRGGGNRLAECLEYATGVPLIENAVRAALGLPLRDLEQRPVEGAWAEVILHSGRPGLFQGLRLEKSAEAALFQRDLWVRPGARVGGFQGANEALGTLLFRADRPEELDAIMENTDRYVHVDVRAEAPGGKI